jgi:hypothetical protein
MDSPLPEQLVSCPVPGAVPNSLMSDDIIVGAGSEITASIIVRWFAHSL